MKSSFTDRLSMVVPRRAANRNYKPVILRAASLVTLLLFTFSLIGVLQYALVRLPTVQGRFGLEKRSEIKQAATMQALEHTPLIRLKVRQDSTVTPPVTTSAPSSDYVPDTSAYLPTETTVPDIASSAAPGAFVPTETTVPIIPSFAAPGDYVPTETTIPDIASSAAPGDYVPTETTIPDIASSAAPGAFVPTETTVPIIPSFAAPGDYVPTETIIPGIASSAAPSAYVPTEYLPVETFPAASAGSSASQSGSRAGIGGANPSENAPLEDHVPAAETKGVTVLRWDSMRVFLGTYLAVVLAVVYRILVSNVQTQLRLIDPFRQLASVNGASASASLFAAYHSQVWFGPLIALRNGRYALSSVGVIFWTSCLLPAFASEAIFVDTNWACPTPDGPVTNPCPPRMTASVSVVRLLQSLLGLAAFVLIGTIFALRGETGLESDPGSIAAVAALMGHPSFEDDLNTLSSGPESTAALMKQEIGHKRYKLNTWVDRMGEQRCGVVPVLVAFNDPNNEKGHRNEQSTAVDWPGTTGTYSPIDPRSSAYNSDTVSHQWRWDDILLLFLVSGAFGTVVAYYFVSGDNGFNTFFNSNTFGPRFILTGSATVIANMWAGVEENSTVMAPFIRLANAASSFHTLSFAPTITPILSTWRTFSHGYWFAGTVTIMTLLSEVLSVSISGVPFATGQTWLNFLVVAYISMAILGVMIMAAVAVIIHRKREPKIPVVPDTLGVKMSYMAGSKMLRNFTASDAAYGGNRLRGERFRFQLVTREYGTRSWKVDQLDSC